MTQGNSLVHVDRAMVFDELLMLRNSWTTAGHPEESGDFVYECTSRAVKRLRALLPADPDLAANVCIITCRSLLDYLDCLTLQYGLDQKDGFIGSPPDERSYKVLQRFIGEFTPEYPRDFSGDSQFIMDITGFGFTTSEGLPGSLETDESEVPTCSKEGGILSGLRAIPPSSIRWKDGEPTEITSQQYRMMTALLEAPVIKWGDFSEKVWGKDVKEVTIQTAISRLNSSLIAATPPIPVTVSWENYYVKLAIDENLQNVSKL